MSILDNFEEMKLSGIAIQRKSIGAADSFGQKAETWATAHATVSGLKRTLSGDKRFVSSVHGYDADCRFYLPPLTDCIPGDRITYGGKYYEVKSVNKVMEQGEVLQVDTLWVKNV